MNKIACAILCLVILAGIFVVNVSAVKPDDAIWTLNKPWVVANGADTATISVEVINMSDETINGLTVNFQVNSSVFGSMSPTQAVLQNGRANSTFTVKNKSGVANISAIISYKINDDDPEEPYQTAVFSKLLNIDHDAPYVLASYTVPPQITVGSVGDIRLAYTDQWGNPVDNRRESEELYFEITSPGETAKFVNASAPGTAIQQYVDSTGNFRIQMIASEQPGTNIILAHPVAPGMGDLPDRYFYIQAIANGTPRSIEQYFDPEGYLGQPPKQYADGVSLYQIVYTVKDQYGNGIMNTPISIRTDLPGEETVVSTNPWGQAMLTYGPKSTIGRITIYAESVVNPAVNISKEVMFISQEAVDMQFTAIPETMPSRDVLEWQPAELRAKVIDENGNPVEGETVTFTIGTPWYDMEVYNATMGPELENTTAISDVDGYAIALFDPGAFSVDWADELFNPSSTGEVEVTAHWENATRGLSSTHSLNLTWKNYPYLSLSTSVYPQTVNVSNTVDVLIQLRGDGWALQPNPIDVVLCTDRSGSMLYNNSDGIIDDRMVHAISAAKIFNSQMSAIRDRVGLVSFGDNSATSGWANLTPRYYYSTYYHKWRWDWSGVYSNWYWVSRDDRYDCEYSSDYYSLDSVHQKYVDAHYPGTPRYYGTTQYASEDLVLSFDRTSVNNTINQMVPAGGTPMREGLYRSVKMILDHPRPISGTTTIKAIVLLSDGAWNTGGNPEGGSGVTSFPEISTGSVIDWANTSGIKIFTVALGSDPNREELQSYATKTGGKYYSTDKADELSQIYEDIAGELRLEAGVNTQVDLDFGTIEVNYEMIEVNDTFKVFDYVSDPVLSTRIHSYNETADIIPSYVRNDTQSWNENKSLYFDAGTIKLGQIWEARYRLRVLTDGSINIFGPGSQIIFNNGESTLFLPQTLITGVPSMVSTGVNTSELNITTGDSSSGTDDSGMEYVEWPIYREYTGIYNVTERYYISNDGGMQWILLGETILTPEEANQDGYFRYPKILLPPGIIDFKVESSALDAPGPIIAVPPQSQPNAIPTGTYYIRIR